jgi:hypothetical protein
MRLVSLCLVMCAVPVLAQVQPKPVVKKAAPAQKVDFTESDLIEGTLQGPDGHIFVGKDKPVFKSLTLVRDNFNDKLMDSVDEM